MRWFPLLLVTVTAIASLGPSGAAGSLSQQPATSAPQVFEVKLTLTTPATTTISGGSPVCAGQQRDRLEQIRFQFQLSLSDSPPTLAVSPSGSSVAPSSAGGTATLQANGPGFTFDRVTVSTSLDSYALSRGSLRLGAISGGSAPNGLTIDQVRVEVTSISGDVVLYCQADATGAGVTDHTPPTVSIPSPCSTGAQDPCMLLADGALTIAFSKPVLLAGIPPLVTATADDRTAVRLFASRMPRNSGYGLAFQGYWPLGHSITLQVAAGVRDLAGNVSTTPVEQTFQVVDDPGDLDVAGNSGFESGDLSGYTVLGERNFDHFKTDPAFDASAASAFGFGRPAINSVVNSFVGIQPSEGSWMLQIGALATCSGDIAVFTAHFRVPAAVSALVIDFNGVQKASQPSYLQGSGVLLSASLRGADAVTAAAQTWPPASDTSLPAGNGTTQTGWRQLRLSLDGLTGQVVVLTLQAAPQQLEVPPLCHGGVLLLDNLHFE